MRKNCSKQMLTMLLASLTISLLASCGGTGNNNTSTPEGKRPTLRIFMNGGNSYEGRKKDSVWKALEENTNVSLNIEGAAHNSDYYTTLNPMINTGDIPDVIFAVPNDSSGAYDNWVDQDIVYNIDELLAEKPGEYPYIEALFESNQFKNLTFGEGKHTLLPYITSNSGWGIYYRTDWLINVGYYTEVNGEKVAKTPKTIEEFAEVLKLFTENDPDQNGKKDTFGLSPYGETFYLNPLYHAFGVTPDYDIDKDGNGTYMFLENEFKEFLTWFHDMYNKGYVDPQFATNKNSDDRTKFYEGKVGILISNAEQHVSWIADAFENANGVGKLTFGDAPVGTANLGKEGASGFSDWGGYWGGYSISTDCKDPHAALRFFNYLYSPEGSKLRCYGIEGVHYNVVDGNIVPNIEGRNEEPTDTFITNKDKDGNTVPNGYYKFGSAFFNNVVWSDDNKTIKNLIEPEILDSKYSDLIKFGLEKNTLCTSKMTNVTGYYSSYRTKMNRIEDATNIYAINAIMGNKNLTSDYNALISSLSGKTYDWPNVSKMIAEIAKKAGVK